jgi:hypothetical protein
MLVRSKALRHAARAVLRPVAFSTRNTTKTTKSFSELPSVFLYPDGTAALPLGEWHAGPERTPLHG